MIDTSSATSRCGTAPIGNHQLSTAVAIDVDRDHITHELPGGQGRLPQLGTGQGIERRGRHLTTRDEDLSTSVPVEVVHGDDLVEVQRRCGPKQYAISAPAHEAPTSQQVDLIRTVAVRVVHQPISASEGSAQRDGAEHARNVDVDSSGLVRQPLRVVPAHRPILGHGDSRQCGE